MQMIRVINAIVFLAVLGLVARFVFVEIPDFSLAVSAGFESPIGKFFASVVTGMLLGGAITFWLYSMFSYHPNLIDPAIRRIYSKITARLK